MGHAVARIPAGRSHDSARQASPAGAGVCPAAEGGAGSDDGLDHPGSRRRGAQRSGDGRHPATVQLSQAHEGAVPDALRNTDERRRELRDRGRRISPAGDLRLDRLSSGGQRTGAGVLSRASIQRPAAGAPQHQRPRQTVRHHGGSERATNGTAPSRGVPMILAWLTLGLLQTQVAVPVLDFPEAGLDDTASNQGYQTRFYRDSEQNAVQIYLEPRSG